jgi:hypothetical protein
MSKERQLYFQENPLVKGGLYFVGALVIAGVSISLINKVLAMG